MPIFSNQPVSAVSRVTVPPSETEPPPSSPLPAVTVIEELARSLLEIDPLTIMVPSMPLTLNSVPTNERPVPAVYVVSESLPLMVTTLLSAPPRVTLVLPAPVNCTVSVLSTFVVVALSPCSFQ